MDTRSPAELRSRVTASERLEKRTFRCGTVQETRRLAARTAALAAPPLVIFLSGDLGTGKTTFAGGFIHALGYRGKVKSPTYTLVNEYPVRGFDVFHFDFYRLVDTFEFESMGGRDYFDERSVCLIEWPERAAAVLPEADVRIRFTHADNGRLIEIQTSGKLNLGSPEE